MPLNARFLARATRLPSLIRTTPRSHRAFASAGGKLPGGTPGETSEQAVPIGPYYESILIKPQPVPEVKPEEPPTSSPKSPRTTTKKTPASNKKPAKDSDAQAAPASSSPSSAATNIDEAHPEVSSTPATAQEKARIVFGSRLVGPAERAERLEAMRKRSTWVAGILVPPRPEEPDNCCMSGCVNCVWERYRDEMEEWATASTRAEEALQAQRRQGPVDVMGSVSAVKRMPRPDRGAAAVSMDDDGGGSETNWQADLLKAQQPKIAKDLWDEDLYKNVPVGIREFMKQEKKLKQRHEREGSFGA
ncbi:oxidoreductase-like protein [Xylariomycetidae sp. FL2044]|nr:oxidoreductase-like protein [Xylariomycetidae sp. FL2044]